IFLSIFLSSGFCQNKVEGTNLIFGKTAEKEEPVVREDASLIESTNYTLGKNDVVQIDVREQPEFSGQFVIGPDGNIQYRFVGDIRAEGLTKEELKEIITKELERYIKIPEVSISIIAYKSKYIYVLGEVYKPNKYTLYGNYTTLREALIMAGLPTPNAALRRVYVIKPDVNKPIYRKVDIYKLLYLGKLKDDLILTSGDLVVVPSTVPSEINRALTNLLSPISRSAAVEALVSEYGNR
ncbi:MAG: polysaccharide export protein, partial [Candidatus Omnitrophica bacterium]|nr:polysaccharide export protein [Candidatus Omnitrophota bacterium]